MIRAASILSISWQTSKPIRFPFNATNMMMLHYLHGLRYTTIILLLCIPSTWVSSWDSLKTYLKGSAGGYRRLKSILQAPITHAVGDASLPDENTTGDRHTRYWNFHGSAVRRGGGKGTRRQTPVGTKEDSEALYCRRVCSPRLKRTMSRRYNLVSAFVGVLHSA